MMGTKRYEDMLVSDVMHKGCTCVEHDATLVEAAKQMRDEGVGALPICGADDKLVGMLTDRDIVINCIAADKMPTTCTAGELASGRLIWIFEDEPASKALHSMEEHLIRRLPVLDRDKQLIGMVSQADIARHMGHEQSGELVEAISAAEPRQSVAF